MHHRVMESGVTSIPSYNSCIDNPLFEMGDHKTYDNALFEMGSDFQFDVGGTALTRHLETPWCMSVFGHGGYKPEIFGSQLTSSFEGIIPLLGMMLFLW